MTQVDSNLSDWRSLAGKLEQAVQHAVIGQDAAIHLLTTALFSRGHVLLEGDVGVGKTTLLRAFSRATGGDYARLEGSVDLMPNDLIYYTYLNEDGKPRVDPGPLLQKGESLSTFFFNEINRARPQVHSLLLRVMAERSVQAFNRDFSLPHLQVFADRNRLEKEETFELPSAARDRFFMELNIGLPKDRDIQRELMSNPRFHDSDALIDSVEAAVLPYSELNGVAAQIQSQVQCSDTLLNYVLDLCEATRRPMDYGLSLEGVALDQFIQAGVSPRGMSMLVRAARVTAWLDERDYVQPEDVRKMFISVAAHRIFLQPVYEMQRDAVIPEFVDALLGAVATP